MKKQERMTLRATWNEVDLTRDKKFIQCLIVN